MLDTQTCSASTMASSAPNRLDVVCRLSLSGSCDATMTVALRMLVCQFSGFINSSEMGAHRINSSLSLIRLMTLPDVYFKGRLSALKKSLGVSSLNSKPAAL